MPTESTPILEHGGATFRNVERKSNLRAYIFVLESFVVLGGYLYLLYGREPAATISALQTHILAAFGVIYTIRINVMTVWLLPREVGIEELTFVALVWLPAIMGSYAWLAKDFSDNVVVYAIAFVLYVFGSYLNTGSELQRKLWKQKPENKGKCYTLGLFSWCRNVNYFGDSVLFTGWTIVTGNWVNAWAPVIMTVVFYFHHIPEKEEYLAVRYAEDWPAYLIKTPYALVPFVC